MTLTPFPSWGRSSGDGTGAVVGGWFSGARPRADTRHGRRAFLVVAGAPSAQDTLIVSLAMPEALICLLVVLRTNNGGAAGVASHSRPAKF